jgi:CRP-like cAMP-binding protein
MEWHMTLSRAEIEAVVARTMLFHSLSDEARKAVVDCARARPFAVDEPLVEEGCRVEGLALMVSGSVRVHTQGMRGEHIELKVLNAGAYFGEVGFLNKMPATATVTGLEAGTVIVFAADDLEGVIVPFPQVRKVLERLALRRAEDTIEKTLK